MGRNAIYNIRLRWVWCQDNLLDGDDIVFAFGRGIAELQGRLAGDIELVAGGDAVGLAVNAESGDARRKESDDCCGKPHGDG